MCNVYSLTKGRQAIREAARAMPNVTGILPPFSGIFPDYAALLVRMRPMAFASFPPHDDEAKLSLLLSVDQVEDGRGAANFKICAWRTNDAKHTLTHDDVVALCRLVVEHFACSN